MTTPSPGGWAPTFSDTEGREWRVVLTDDVAREIGADKLERLFCELLLGRFRSNGRDLVEALYVCCEEQADAAWILPEVFGRAMRDAEVIAAAGMALMAAVSVRRGMAPEQVRKVFEAHTKE
jgi:hypothetical protein